jgi:TnsA endonuclease N terminal
MAKAHKGAFRPRNPQKYLGRNISQIVYRSSWELSAMLEFDSNVNVVAWMSESLPSKTVHSGIDGIPYRNPFTGKPAIYVPDFFVMYVDRNTTKHSEVIEIKPSDEILGFTGKVSNLKEARQILNAAKYIAAVDFCRKRGWVFRIITERELFNWTKKK